MITYAAQLLIFLLSAESLAGGLPANTKITPENANQYSISVENLGSGDPKILLYRVQFSEKLEECMAGRVQTFLFAGDRELSASSMDYPVQSSAPSLLVHFPAKDHDMVISIQYCCISGPSPGCKKSLSIDSLKDLLNAENGS